MSNTAKARSLALYVLKQLKNTLFFRVLVSLYRYLGIRRLAAVVYRRFQSSLKRSNSSFADHGIHADALHLPSFALIRSIVKPSEDPEPVTLVTFSTQPSREPQRDTLTVRVAAEPNPADDRQVLVHVPYVVEQSHPEVLSMPAADEPLDWLVNPMLPSHLGQDRRQTTIDPSDLTAYQIQPGQTSFTSTDPPLGWHRCVNAEGQVIFHHKEKNILTEALIYNEFEAAFITRAGNYLRDKAQRELSAVMSECQLVLLMKKFPECESHDDDGWRCLYYFAHHQSRLLYWLEPFYLGHTADVRGKLAAEHAKLVLEWEYWKHYQYFDPAQKPSNEDWDELKQIITFSEADVLTSKSSTCSETKARLQDMARIVGYRTPQGCAWVLGRFMERLVQGRVQNFYGQPNARLDYFQSIYSREPSSPSSHSAAFELFSPLLFWAPGVHLDKLQDMWTDQVTRKKLWKKLVKTLAKEWQQYTGFGTLLLTTNSAFLAINPVWGNGTDVGPVWPAVFFSFASTLFGFGTVILCLLMGRQYKSKGRNVGQLAAFLWRQHDQKRGLEALAVLLSLPYVLLLWGMIFLAAAFLCFCYDCQKHSYASVTLISLSWLPIVCLMLWCIMVPWDWPRYCQQVCSYLHEINWSLSELRHRTHTTMSFRWKREANRDTEAA